MGKPKGYRVTDKERELHALSAARIWAAMSEEERELRRLSIRLGTLKRWRTRTEAERRAIGKAISEGRRKAKAKKEVEE